MTYFNFYVIDNMNMGELESHIMKIHDLAEVDDYNVEDVFYNQIYNGNNCCAIEVSSSSERIYGVIPLLLGRKYFIVRFIDHGSWQVTAYDKFTHVVNHNVNPWCYDNVKGLKEEMADIRAKKFTDFWGIEHDSVCRYFSFWKTRKNMRWVPRKGKAYEDDEHDYCDAYQFMDFMKKFGLDVNCGGKSIEYENNE